MNRDRILGLALCAGPVVWMLYFGAVFALSGWTCSWQSRLALYILSTVALLLTLAGIVAAWDQWRTLGKDWPGEAGGPAARAKTVAIFALGLNVMFLLVVIAQTIPHIMMVGCE